jgi:hypothetical protein
MRPMIVPSRAKPPTILPAMAPTGVLVCHWYSWLPVSTLADEDGADVEDGRDIEADDIVEEATVTPNDEALELGMLVVVDVLSAGVYRK